MHYLLFTSSLLPLPLQVLLLKRMASGSIHIRLSSVVEVVPKGHHPFLVRPFSVRPFQGLPYLGRVGHPCPVRRVLVHVHAYSSSPSLQNALSNPHVKDIIENLKPKIYLFIKESILCISRFLGKPCFYFILLCAKLSILFSIFFRCLNCYTANYSSHLRHDRIGESNENKMQLAPILMCV